MLHHLASKSRKNLALHKNRSTFFSQWKELLKQAERDLIELLSEELKNVVHSIETELPYLPEDRGQRYLPEVFLWGVL